VFEAGSPALRALLEAMMTQTWQPRSDLLERIDARAHEAGREEGREEGRESALRELLLGHAAAADRVLGDEARQRLQAASAVELQAWLRRLLTGASVDEVLGAVLKATARR
jgi:predicted transposase YdaD